MVDITDPTTNEVWSYHMDKKIQAFLERRVKDAINKHDKDYVCLIDGYEGSGKSTFGMQLARYVDTSFNLDRVCMTSDEFKKAIINAKPGQAVIYDEAVTGMSAGESITRVGRLLKSMMMQMRQKNLFVIVILPSVFELNKYTVLARARFFFHVYEISGRMGYWVGFNRNDLKKLYLNGKKTYSYKIWSSFKGRFYGKYAVNEELYRKKKSDALFKLEEPSEEFENEGKWKRERRIFISNLFKYMKSKENISSEQFIEIIKRIGVDMERRNLGMLVTKTENEGKLVFGKTPIPNIT